MAERFIKFIPSEEAMFLLKKKGHAFRLLTIIAESARREAGHPDGLEPGEAFIGGHEKYDMTEQNYRTAKRVLEERGHIKIVETNRTRNKSLTRPQRNPNTKSTTGVTTEGTKVKLLSSNVYDLNLKVGNDLSNDRLTTDSRLTNDKQERKERKESSPNPLNSKSDDDEKFLELNKIPAMSEKLKIELAKNYGLQEIRDAVNVTLSSSRSSPTGYLKTCLANGSKPLANHPPEVLEKIQNYLADQNIIFSLKNNSLFLPGNVIISLLHPKAKLKKLIEEYVKSRNSTFSNCA